jgi:hypothetical protein
VSNKIGLLALASVFLVACCTLNPTLSPKDRTDSILSIENETLALVMLDANGAMSGPYCTAVWVSDHMILTAAHCVEYAGMSMEDLMAEKIMEMLGLDDPEPKLPIGKEVLYATNDDIGGQQDTKFYRKSKVVAYDSRDDLALLEADADGIPLHGYPQIDYDPIPVGLDIAVVGQPMGQWWTYNYGRVSAFRPGMKWNKDKIHTNAMQLQIPQLQGNSGSGVFTEDGRLLGILSAIASPSMSLAVHRDIIVSFLKANHVLR